MAELSSESLSGPIALLGSLPVAEQGYIANRLIKHKQGEPGPTELDVAYFLWRARTLDLDPFGGQLIGVMYRGSLSLQVTHEGYLAVAERTGRLVSIDTEWDREPDDKPPVWARATVTYIDRSERECRRAFRALLREFTRSTESWRGMPWHMLGLRAECHAIRRAFPDLTAGLELAHDEPRKVVGVVKREGNDSEGVGPELASGPDFADADATAVEFVGEFLGEMPNVFGD